MPRPPRFEAPWTCTNEAMPCYQWGKRAAVWRGAKGWWASRQGQEGIQGPFRSMKQAQAWAESPWRERHDAKIASVLEAKETKAALQAAKEAATWGGLPEEKRSLAAGQVWALRDGRLAGYEILILEVKRTTAGVLSRRSQSEPWKDAAKEVRSLATLPRLYRLVGTAKVPKEKS